MERVRETEKNTTFPGSVGHICQEMKDNKIRKLATAHAYCCFSVTFQQLSFNHYLLDTAMWPYIYRIYMYI